MNGDVNGTMTEPVEVKVPHSPVSKSDQTKVTPEDCDQNTNDCESKNVADESCNDIDSDSKNCNTDNGLPEGSANEISNCSIQSNGNNSNQSNPESTSSSHRNFKLSESQVQDRHTESKDTNNTVDDNGQNEIHQDSIDEEESDVESAAEGSAVSGERRAEDTVSINSESGSEDEDDTSQEEQTKINDIIVLDGENRPGNSSSEVHEIVSDNETDDCVIAGDEKGDSNNSEEKVQLRRSSRTVKRKSYNYEGENGDDLDIDDMEFGPPSKRKAKPIVINDTKVLVAMAAKQMKTNHSNNQKKEPTVVIIDTNSATPGKIPIQHNKTPSPLTNASINAQNLYQSIVARGTTVTPISSKNHNSSPPVSQPSQNAQPIILPSLSDDMFVVEAPSFIVPYVYEKPSIKPFRQFVDKLGKELEEEKLKEELKEKEIKEKEKQEKKERGEEVESEEEQPVNTEHEDTEEKEEAIKKKSNKEQKKRRNDEDDASWDGESASQSDDDVLSDDDDKIVVKDKIEPIEQINAVTELTVDKICTNKTNGFSSMDCSLGKFFINIGLNLVQEYVQTDLLKQQNRKLYKEKKAGHSTKVTESSIVQLMKNLNLSKENNAPYSFPQVKCEFCSFKTESKLVMAQHLETPHMKNNMYKCNFCTFEIRSPHDILFHMEAEHNIRGKLERAPSYHQCANCPFEDNGKGKLARHLIACAKKFKPDSNLAPPVDWEPPAKIPKIARPRNNIMTPYQNSFNRGQMNTPIRNPITIGGMMTNVNSYRPRGRSPMGMPPRNPPVQGIAIVRGPTMMRQNSPSPAQLSNSYPLVNNAKPKSLHQPSISITPLPRQPQPVQQMQTSNVANNKSTFVICEICDGYIKDLEQLRNHMQWIHKVKIHPKMIYNRPPLNCQKCQFRFFTDQGLERHLLGSHGLVTSSMQEAANKGKDAGRCPVCGRVYQWKLLSHVARDHNLTLKPAHLSYKCTVCTATFGMYKQFENHVYSAHSVVAKRVMDKSKSGASKSTSDTLLKPLKINDEITIIPQPVKAAPPATGKDK